MFLNFNEAQWRFYAEMCAQDMEAEYDSWVNMIEYLASFDHRDAVQQIRQSRELAKQHSFADDEEFIKQMEEKRYEELSKIYADAIKHNTNLRDKSKRKIGDSERKGRDLTYLPSLLKKVD